MLEIRSKKTKKAKISIASLITATLALIAAFLMLVFDKGPPLPPFPKDFQSIDCEGVKLVNFTDNEGNLTFLFSAKPSVEYPPEYLPNFISVTINSNGHVLHYSGEEIMQLTRNDTNINFTIQHAFAGPSKIETRCLKQFYDSFEANLKNIQYHYKDSSHSNNPYDDLAEYEDVCYEYGKFLVFSPIRGQRKPLPHDHHPMNVEFLDYGFNDYMKYKNVTKDDTAYYLVSQVPQDAWKISLFWAAPIASSLEKHQETKKLFLLRENATSNTLKALKKFMKVPPALIKDIHCFSRLYITKAMSSIDLHKNEDMNFIINDFEPLRNAFIGEGESKYIVLGDELSFMRPLIQDEFPNKTVSVIRVSSTISDVSEKCGHAIALIGSHVSSLAQAIWMPKNSTLIDATDPKYSCNKWINRIVNSRNLSYIQVFPDHKQCTCSKFDCYPNEPNKLVEPNDIIKILKSIIKE